MSGKTYDSLGEFLRKNGNPASEPESIFNRWSSENNVKLSGADALECIEIITDLQTEKNTAKIKELYK